MGNTYRFEVDTYMLPIYTFVSGLSGCRATTSVALWQVDE